MWADEVSLPGMTVARQYGGDQRASAFLGEVVEEVPAQSDSKTCSSRPALAAPPALAPTCTRKSGVWQIAYGLMKSAEIGRPVDFKRSDDLDLGGVIGLRSE
jgi:hypothetical protein